MLSNPPWLRPTGNILVHHGERGVVIAGWVAKVIQPLMGAALVHFSTHHIHHSAIALGVDDIFAGVVEVFCVFLSQVNGDVCHSYKWLPRRAVMTCPAHGRIHVERLVGVAGGQTEMCEEVLQAGRTAAEELADQFSLCG